LVIGRLLEAALEPVSSFKQEKLPPNPWQYVSSIEETGKPNFSKYSPHLDLDTISKRLIVWEKPWCEPLHHLSLQTRQLTGTSGR